MTKRRVIMSNKELLDAIYYDQKFSAKDRGIIFLLTFEEWWGIWTASGHWAERGRKRGQYCMARIGDVGPYAVGNVEIILVEENAKANMRRPHRRAQAAAALTKWHNDRK